MQTVVTIILCSSLVTFGAYVRPMPYSNEVGLQMLTGGAVREAFVQGCSVAPLKSWEACR
jgi:tRNA (guanine26-N2/guanine27-N2)-dimethyltransferase